MSFLALENEDVYFKDGKNEEGVGAFVCLYISKKIGLS